MGRRPDKLTPLRQALRRLESSDTYLTRRNARRGVEAELAKIQREMDEKYPKLRRDGTEIIPKKSRKPVCPLCQVPISSGWLGLVNHFLERHRSAAFVRYDVSHNGGLTCACGYQGDKRKMVRHLVGLKDMHAHFAEQIILRSAAQKKE